MEQNLIQLDERAMMDRITKAGAVIAKLDAERQAIPESAKDTYRRLSDRLHAQDIRRQKLVMDYVRLRRKHDPEMWLQYREYREEEGREEPGKFEGEDLWVRKAYEWSADGSWEQEGSVTENGIWSGWAQVTWEDIEECPQLDLGEWMVIQEDSQGFVRGWLQDSPPEIIPDPEEEGEGDEED